MEPRGLSGSYTLGMDHDSHAKRVAARQSLGLHVGIGLGSVSMVFTVCRAMGFRGSSTPARQRLLSSGSPQTGPA